MALFFTLLLLASGCAAYEIVKPPEDTSVYIGDTFTMDCRVADTGVEENVEWLEFISDALGARISLDDEIRHPNADKYEIISMFNLVVKNATLEDGGRYGCRLIRTEGVVYSAVVAVFDKPQCSSPPELLVGETAEINCSLQYRGAEEQPDIHFYDGERQLNTSSPVTDDDTVTITANVTATWQDNDKAYACQVALDTPPHQDNCSSVFNVVYSARNINILPEGNEFYEGDELICSANGNPQPQFVWEKLFPPPATTVQGAVLTINGSMVGTNRQWRCVATNTVRGVAYEVHVNKTFLVRYGTPPNAATTTHLAYTWAVIITTLFLSQIA